MLVSNLIALLVIWFFLSLFLPIKSPVPILTGFFKRMIIRLTKATGRKVWWHLFSKQQQRRGTGFALQHLILIWNIFATIIILSQLNNPQPTSFGITAQQALPGLILFWAIWFLSRKGHDKWRKFKSPRRRLPGRHR